MAIAGIVLFALLLLACRSASRSARRRRPTSSVDPLLDAEVIFRAFFNFISRYSLMAIPLFIFAGFLMEKTGLVAQLFRFADSLVGWLPGGFGVATVVACVLFGAISGSSVAMAAAMSVIAIPEMTKRGYPDWLAAGLVATAGGIAILIPPSILLLLYGIVTETSVVRLFFAGVIPGLMLALGNIVTRHGHRAVAQAAAREVRRRARAARNHRRAAGARHAGRHPRRALRRALHADRSRGRRLRLRADLRAHRRAGRVPERAAARRERVAQPDRA